MVVSLKKDEAMRYLEKAEKFYNAALDEFAKKSYDVSIFNSSQATILANDAYCIAFIG